MDRIRCWSEKLAQVRTWECRPSSETRVHMQDTLSCAAHDPNHPRTQLPPDSLKAPPSHLATGLPSITGRYLTHMSTGILSVKHLKETKWSANTRQLQPCSMGQYFQNSKVYFHEFTEKSEHKQYAKSARKSCSSTNLSLELQFGNTLLNVSIKSWESAGSWIEHK